MTKPPRFQNKPSPEKYALSGTEEAEQIALFMWASLPEIILKYPELKWLFAIPNGGFRHKATAARLVAAGVKSGVPDTFLPIKRGKYAGLFIEMKRRRMGNRSAGTTTDKQDVWIEFLLTQSYGACVCYGWEHARDMLIGYLEYKGE